MSFRDVCVGCARAVAVALVHFAALPVAAILPGNGDDPPMQPRGIEPGIPYVTSGSGTVDAISPMTGSVNLAIPVGPRYHVNANFGYQITLYYSSNVWSYAEGHDQTQGDYVAASLDSDFNSGLGWTLGFGRLVHPDDPENPTESWIWIDGQGARHKFFQILHEDDPGDGTNFLYTRDNSYARLNISNSSSRKLELANGEIQSFDGNGRITKMEDRWGNSLSFVYVGNDLKLVDSHNRIHWISFTDRGGGRGFNVEQVELDGYGDTATYVFDYEDTTIRRTCHDTYWGNNVTPGSANAEEALVNVSLLRQVTGPIYLAADERTTWNIKNGSSADYHRGDVRSSNQCTFSGVIESLESPSKGLTSWEWQKWSFPPTGKAYRDSSPGVKKREVTNYHPASETGTWAYTPRLLPAGNPTEIQTEVVDPENRTQRFFFYAPPTTPAPWDYGLPISKIWAPDAGGRRRSSDLTDRHGSLIQVDYVEYTSDSLTGVPDEDKLQTNRRLRSSSTVFPDDGNRFVRTVLSDFDGLGHYRTVTMSSDFPDGTGSRVEHAQWNNPQGCYSDCRGAADFTPIATGSPWLLQTLAHTYQTEAGDSTWQKYSFDNKGGLTSIRLVRTQGANTTSDVVHRYCLDSSNGNVASERWFGGDTQNPDSANQSCGATSDSLYRLDYSYSYGTRSSSRFRSAAGGSVGFDNNWTATVHETGLVTRTCDSANYCTDFTYDRAGRLTAASAGTLPNSVGVATVSYSYAYDSTAGGGWVVSTELACGSLPNCNSASFPAQKVHHDSLGRPYKQLRRNADGTWSKQVSRHNPLGWVTSVSEWVPEGYSDTSSPQTMVYRPTDGSYGFDGFGRPKKIFLPDGKEVGLQYAGVRIRKTIQFVATGTEAEGWLENAIETKREAFDFLGRLVKVTEPSGAGGALIDTLLSYNSIGQLTQIHQGGQYRTYTYDRRGFLLQESYPELGAAGNGTMYYCELDALGLPGRRRNAACTNAASQGQKFTWDGAGRLTRVYEQQVGGPLLKEFTYDVGSWGSGKLGVAKSFNYFTGTGELGLTLEVRESYAYGGIGGSLASRTTQFFENGVAAESFTTGVTLDRAGQVTEMTYPACSGGACGTGPVGARTVSATYSRGWLTGMPGFAPSISYHTNGMPSVVAHANGMEERTLIDTASMMQRPSAINVWNTNNSPATGVFLSGNYLYDGAGNIKAIGSYRYRYDGVSRLVESKEGGFAQLASFDAYGSIQSLTTGGSALSTTTSAATNRLTGAGISYDELGNQTLWNGNGFSYDKLGRMRKLTSGGQSWYFAYTAGDERIWIKRQSDGLERWTLRGLDGQVLREYDAEWLSDYKDYVWRGRNLLARIEPTTLRVPAPRIEQTLHVATDHLGTPRAVTDAAGSVVESRRYYPFGAEITTMASSDRMQFTGHERDDWGTTSKADDFDYLHARSYNPQLARFLQVDPFPGWPSQPQTLNRYAYVTGNPISFIDPWGLDGVDGSGQNKECVNGKVDDTECGDVSIVTTPPPKAAPNPPGPIPPLNQGTPGHPNRPNRHGNRGGHRPDREKEKDPLCKWIAARTPPDYNLQATVSMIRHRMHSVGHLAYRNRLLGAYAWMVAASDYQGRTLSTEYWDFGGAASPFDPNREALYTFGNAHFGIVANLIGLSLRQTLAIAAIAEMTDPPDGEFLEPQSDVNSVSFGWNAAEVCFE